MGAKDPWIPTITECISLYLDEQKSRNRAVVSIENYKQKLDILERYLADRSITTIDELSTDVLKRYLQSRREGGLKPHTVATDACYIKAWLNYLIEIEIITVSPMSKVKLPKLPKLQKVAYSVDEIK